MDGTVNRSELLVNVVIHNEPKVLGLNQKGKWLGSRAPISLDADTRAIGG
jgi:hypothetical protein